MSLQHGSISIASTKKSWSFASSNLERNEKNNLLLIARILVFSSSSNTLARALIRGITCHIKAVSAEMFLVISFIGVKMLIIFVAILNCETVSTGIDL